MNLRDFAKNLKKGNTISFMEGRTKGDLGELVDVTVTIKNFAFLKNEEGEYAVFIVNERPDNFYFGGMVITDNLKSLENAGYKDEIIEVGLPVKVYSRKSKNKKTYYGLDLCPDD